MEVDGKHVSKSSLNTFSAHKGNVSVRLESYDITTLILKINNRTQSLDLKTDMTELICLREVLNSWHGEYFGAKK